MYRKHSRIPLSARQSRKETEILACILLFLPLLFLCNCKAKQSNTLLILHAGSLSVPFEKMTKAFMKEYPSIDVQTEAAGSLICARKIIDFSVPADIIASADSAIIRNLLIPQFADFCIDFCSNEMVIMYRKESKHSDRITASNWYEILLNESVEYGHSDPNSDPCGYRTLICWQLAEEFYNVSGLYQKLIRSRPIKNIRPKEVDLLALLETGELDYIFIYRSVAEQHKGLYLTLPNQINLKSSELADHYQRASVEISWSSPGDTVVKRGSPMLYGITIPKTARSPQLATQFIEFVLSPKGQQIMKENGQPEIVPALVDNSEALPSSLKQLVKKEER